MRNRLFIFLIGLLIASVPSVAGPTGAHARQLMESGLAHERLGQHQQALDDFTQALSLRGLSTADRVRATFDQGVALDALGRTADAVASYSAALRLQTDFGPALNNRANAFRRLGRLDDAKRDYLAALKSNGAAREYPYYGLGYIAERMGDTETARDYYRRALSINPGFALAAQSLAGLKPSRGAPAALAASTAPVVQSPAARHDPVPLRRAIDEHPAPAARGPDPVQRSDNMVQLGAYRDDASARQAWGKFVAAGGILFEGLSPLVVTVDLPGKGRFWRLRTIVPDSATARRLCITLMERGLTCFVVRS